MISKTFSGSDQEHTGAWEGWGNLGSLFLMSSPFQASGNFSCFC